MISPACPSWPPRKTLGPARTALNGSGMGTGDRPVDLAAVGDEPAPVRRSPPKRRSLAAR